jgi:TolA-binding protein
LEFYRIMTTVLLDDLAQRISQQEAQLQALRRDLETRQQQLAQLAQRKEQLLTQLEQVDAEIAGIGGDAPAAKSSRAKPAATKPARTIVIAGQPCRKRGCGPASPRRAPLPSHPR